MTNKKEAQEHLNILEHLINELQDKIEAPITNESFRSIEDMMNDVHAHMFHVEGLMYKN